MKETIEIARRKALDLERLSLDEALALYRENDLLFLAQCARRAKELKSGVKVFYNINRHINLTNVCVSRCPLCAFHVCAGERRAFSLELPKIGEILDEAEKTPNLSEIHIVSALSPNLPYEYYLEVIKLVRRRLPHVAIKAFTPVEIVHMAHLAQKSITDVLRELRAAGLDALPGGGAEILSDRVRSIICPRKATAREWLEVMRGAHELNIPTGASIMYGHIETIEERIAHLITIRDLQDKTGGFQSFAFFPFHPAHTGLKFLFAPSAWENLKMLALCRLVLDNIPHMKAFWIMLTEPIAQLALTFGADDLDGTIGEEKIIHAAGATTASGISEEKIRRLIRQTGYEPARRDTFYREENL